MKNKQILKKLEVERDFFKHEFDQLSRFLKQRKIVIRGLQDSKVRFYGYKISRLSKLKTLGIIKD